MLASGPSLFRPKPISFCGLGHCVFCLRKETTQDENVSNKYFRTGSIPLEVTNQVIKHFLSTISGNEVTGFETPPTVCSICADDVRKVHQLLNDLRKATLAIQCTVARATNEGRVDLFLTELKVGKQPENVKESSIDFLQQMGHLKLKFQENKNPVSPADQSPEVKEEEMLEEDDFDTFQDFENEEDELVVASALVKEESCENQEEACEDNYDPELEQMDASSSDEEDVHGDDPWEEELPLRGTNDKAKAPRKTSAKPKRQYRKRKAYENDREDEIRSSNGVRSLRCDFCREVIPLKDLRSHVRAHVGDFAWDCPNPSCYSAFTSASSLKVHLRPYHSKSCSSFSSSLDLGACELCDFKANSQLALRNHLHLTHELGAPKQFQCPVSDCSEMFAHRQSVFSHINHKHRRKQDPSASSFRKCPTCGKTIPNDKISQHFHHVHGVPLHDIVSCKHCPLVYLNYEQLLDHLPAHLKSGVPLICDICTGEEIKFAGMKELREHYLEAHQVGQMHKCQHCDKSFVGLKWLNGHLRATHKLDKEGKLILGEKCDLCPDHVTRRFFHPTILLKHKINEHGAEPFRCQFCDKTFSLQRRCLDHELEHKGIVKPPPGSVVCDIPGCGKVFSSKKRLREHKKTIKHQGQTNAHLCVECGKGFNSSNTLWNHKKLAHSGEKLKFVCDLCGSEFNQKPNLDAHRRRIHTDPMVLNCHLCNRRFSQRRALARHLAHLKPDGTCLGEKNFRIRKPRRKTTMIPPHDAT